MDYKNIYEDFYNKIYLNRVQEIKLELIRAKSESRAFIPSLNKIIKNTEVHVKQNYIYSNIILVKLEIIFKENLIEYDENSIELSLKNDVYPEYLKLNEDSLPLNYSFQKFIGDLGSLHALIEANRLFSNNNSLFKMMFQLNNFTDFEIIDYKMTLEDTPIFKKLHKIIYPNYYEYHPENKSMAVEDPNNNSKKKSKEINEEKILKFNISKFSEDERIFLLHVNYYSKINIPLTEYSKLMLIAHGIADLSLFTTGSKNNRFYDKIYNGIEYYGPSSRREFIDGVIYKIEPFRLTNINKALNLIKSKIK